MKDWSRTQVNRSSKDCFFYKNGKQARMKEIQNTLECYLAPFEYSLESTDKDTEAEHRNLVKNCLVWRAVSTNTPMLAMSTPQSFLRNKFISENIN